MLQQVYTLVTHYNGNDNYKVWCKKLKKNVTFSISDIQGKTA